MSRQLRDPTAGPSGDPSVGPHYSSQNCLIRHTKGGHFRGFSVYWEMSYSSTSAIQGVTSPPRAPVRADQMTEQARRHLNHRRTDTSLCPCAHAVVDISAAPGYHLHMLSHIDPDLADRPDPERQAPTVRIPRQPAESRSAPRARLSIPPAAAPMPTDRSPSSFSRHRARTAPPSLPAVASAPARQRFSITGPTTDTTAIGRRSVGAAGS